MKLNPIDIVPLGCLVTLEIGRNSKYGPLLTLIDPEDYQKVSGIKWGIHFRKAHVGADGSPMPDTFVPRWDAQDGAVYIHRLIMGVTSPDVLVIHKNGNGLDNRKMNLKLFKRDQSVQQFK